MNARQAMTGRITAKVTSAPQKASKSKMLLPLILSVAALLLTACGWQGTGTVSGRTLHEGYWTQTIICASYDSKGNCTVWVPQQNYTPESYSVSVKDDAGEMHEVSVNKNYWDNVKEGDQFDNRDKK